MTGEGTHVSGGQGIEIAGTVDAGGPEATLEWVPLARGPQGRGLLAALEGRLGSEVSAEKVTTCLLCALKQWLGPSLDAVLERLPWSVRGVVRSCEQHLLSPIPLVEDRAGLAAVVASLAQRPRDQAEQYLLAFFGAAKEVLPPELGSAVAGRLPPDVATLWSEAV